MVAHVPGRAGAVQTAASVPVVGSRRCESCEAVLQGRQTVACSDKCRAERWRRIRAGKADRVLSEVRELLKTALPAPGRTVLIVPSDLFALDATRCVVPRLDAQIVKAELFAIRGDGGELELGRMDRLGTTVTGSPVAQRDRRLLPRRTRQAALAGFLHRRLHSALVGHGSGG